MHRDNGWPPPENPLLGIVGCQSDCPLGNWEFTADCYMIGFKKLKSDVILYGCTAFDYSNSTMMFVKPCQIIKTKDLGLEEDGFMLLIHEDYLNDHQLHRSIQKYGCFEYEVNKTLCLLLVEEAIIISLYEKITREYYNNTDEYSKEIILSLIDSMLTYTQRFFNRHLNCIDHSGKTITNLMKPLKAYGQ